MYGCLGDCLSINDISVAFLQADDFPEDDKRYVSYTAYKGAVEHDCVEVAWLSVWAEVC